MSKLISIRDDLYEMFKSTKGTKSNSELIDDLYNQIANLNNQLRDLQETTVTQEGRISKTLAGKTIIYKIKEQ